MTGRITVVLLAVLAVALLSTGAAAQSQISLQNYGNGDNGAGSSGYVVFTYGGASGTANMTFSGSLLGQCSSSYCLTGPGVDANGGSPAFGNFSLSMPSGSGYSLTAPVGGGSGYAFASGSTLNFYYLQSAGNTLQGTIALTDAYLSGTGNVSVYGTLTVNTANGVYAQWGGTNGSTFEMTLRPTPGESSINLAGVVNGSPNSQSGYLATGSLLPNSSPVVPEPASIALLGSGLLAAGSMFKVRRWK
jgi:hypothetical protein